MRDVLMLEVVTLEAVIARIETMLDRTSEAAAELNAETDRLLRIAAGKVGPRSLY